MRLSTTFDCWKKSCHGATVVPTMAKIISVPDAVIPPSIPGTRKPLSTAPGEGWLSAASGSTSKLANRKTNIALSHWRKFPLAVMPIRTSVAIGTTM